MKPFCNERIRHSQPCEQYSVRRASSAAGIAPCNIKFISLRDRPTTIGSPNPPAPMKAARVAVPILMTAAVLIPAKMAGAERAA